MQQNIQTTIKAETIAAAIYTATGQRPTIWYDNAGRAHITFTKEAGDNIQKNLIAQMKKKSDVEIDFLPIVAPIVFSKILPLALVSLATAAFIGYYVGQR